MRVLRNAVQRISAGEPLETIRSLAVNEYLEKAANPGLAVSGVDPFQLASDFASILKTAITALQTTVAPALQPGPSVILSPSVTWASRVLADSAGALHSWLAVDSWNESTLARELHSWYVVGEIAVTGRPMTLHVIEIGRQSGSHQVTPWCRAFRHPLLVGKLAFQSKTGKSLGANWKPVYFERKHDPDDWVDMMERDGVRLVHHVPVRAIAPDQRRRVVVDICMEAARMELIQASDWRDEPMRRTSCDVPPCVWQGVCYGR
jgi:hypothetical protein